MTLRKRLRKGRGNHIVLAPMQHQRRLVERRLVFILPGVIDNLEPQAPFFLEAVMEKRDRSAPPPMFQFLVRIASPPPGGKLERRGQQHQLFYFRMPGRVESREISSQAGAHQNYRLPMNRLFDHPQLPADRQTLKIPFIELWGRERHTRCRELLSEKARLAGLRAGGEPVQVNDSHLSNEIPDDAPNFL